MTELKTELEKFIMPGRMYLPLWKEIKRQYPKPVEISAPSTRLATIKNQMAKEKCRDPDWLFIRYKKLKSCEVPGGLVFWLETYRITEQTLIKTKGKSVQEINSETSEENTND